jgi:hypothetical protein
VTREELEEASRRASGEDKRRLRDGYEALRICTTHDLGKLGLRDVGGRQRVIRSGIEALENTGDCGPDGNQIALAALRELERRLEAYDQWIEDRTPSTEDDRAKPD